VADNDSLILDFVNGRVLDGADLGEYYVSGPDDDPPANWDDIDLEDAFDLPPVLPPVRLPEEAELAGQARRSALLADLRALAGEVRETTVRAAAVNPVLLRLAEEAELVERDDEDLAPGDDAGFLNDLADDSDALQVSGLEKPDEVFEAIARLDHPDAEGVLTMFGRHTTDKKTAKAARRAAYKASTRRATRR
jgi:hypothetical protein